MLGHAPSSVRVTVLRGLGTYGDGPQYDDVAHAAALMSQAVGKPVRVQLMRWDEHGWDNYGPAQLMDVRAGGRREGQDRRVRLHAVGYPPYFTTDTWTGAVGLPIADPTELHRRRLDRR